MTNWLWAIKEKRSLSDSVFGSGKSDWLLSSNIGLDLEIKK